MDVVNHPRPHTPVLRVPQAHRIGFTIVYLYGRVVARQRGAHLTSSNVVPRPYQCPPTAQYPTVKEPSSHQMHQVGR